MILEICASSYQSAVNANIAGAHRIELCSEISVGGTTPSYGLLKKVMADIDIPVHVLIRPRSGNFTYSRVDVRAKLPRMKIAIMILLKQLEILLKGILRKV